MKMDRGEDRSFSVFGSGSRYSCRLLLTPHIRHFPRGGHGSGLDELENVAETSECRPGFDNDRLPPKPTSFHCAITMPSVYGHRNRPET